jgi:hypothetical protein
LEVLEAGKHVLVEKPMAHTIDQACRLVEAAAARQRIYAIAFMKRYDPGVQAAKMLLDDVLASGRLGKLLLARFYNYSKAYAMQPPRISGRRRATSYITRCGQPYRIGSRRDGRAVTNGFSTRLATTSTCCPTSFRTMSPLHRRGALRMVQ